MNTFFEYVFSSHPSKELLKYFFFFCMNAYPMNVNFSLIYCRTKWSIETKSIETLARGTLNWVNFIDFANRWNKCEDLKNIQEMLVALMALGVATAFMSAIASYVSCCSFCSQEGVCNYCFELSVYLSSYRSIYLSIRLSIYLSIYHVRLFV